MASKFDNYFKGYLDNEQLNQSILEYEKYFEFNNIKKIKNFKTLEIGCGYGMRTFIYNKLFSHITAVDPNKKLIKMLKDKIVEKKIKNIVVSISNCESFKTTKKFDLVICSYSFLFVENKTKCLLNINSYLKKNGYLLILEPPKFTLILEKFKSNNKLMIETLNAIICSRKFKLEHFGINRLFGISYLLKKL